jgi:alpha-1,2-mannosyltransferase
VNEPQPSARPDRWSRLGPFAVSAAALAIAALSFRHGHDLAVYWRAARRFLHGSPLYPASDGFFAYRYAPGAAALFSPLAPLPLGVAKALWYGLLVAACAALTWWLPRRRPGARAPLAAVVAFVALSRPLVEELVGGQVNLLVLAVLLLAFAREDDGHPWQAGLLAAAATALKLLPVIVAVDWALRRRWTALGGWLAGVAVFALAPLPFYGLAGALGEHRAWVASISGVSSGIGLDPGNQSVFAIAARLGLPPAAGALAAAALVALALCRRARDERRDLLLFAMALASSFGWIQNFLFAIPSVFDHARAGRRQAWTALALGLPSTLALYDVVGPRWERWAFDHSVLGLPMLLLFLLVAATPRDASAIASARAPRGDGVP